MFEIARIPQLPLLLRTVLLLLVAIGSVECSATKEEELDCNMKMVKSVEIFSYKAKGYLRVHNGEVLANAQKADNHTIYTITYKGHGFLMYDPVSSRFICVRKCGKNKLITRRNPKNLNPCVFEETSSEGYVGYVKLTSCNKTYTMSFNKTRFQRLKKSDKLDVGLQSKKRRNPNKGADLFLKTRPETNNCSLPLYVFCEQIKKIKLHKVDTYLRELCPLDRKTFT